MIDTRVFKMLQYNVRNEKTTVMMPLLADEKIKEYAVLAIQEPWKNPWNHSSYNPSSGNFHLAGNGEVAMRVCFYVNKDIDIDSWSVEYIINDACTLTIRTTDEIIEELEGEPIGTENAYRPTDTQPEGQSNRQREIRIHNVYNPSPISYSSINGPSTLPAIQCMLDKEGDQILLGDFNLHHPLWNHKARLTRHAMAVQLITLTTFAGLDLATEQETITRENARSCSTLDLTFTSPHLTEATEHCRVAPELSQGSDHNPISMGLGLRFEKETEKRVRQWKKANVDLMRERLKSALPPREALGSIVDIERTVESVQQAINKAIDETVPWADITAWSKPFWNSECDRAVAEARRSRRACSSTSSLDNWRSYYRAIKRKGKIIRKESTKHFRQQIQEATEEDRIWKLTKWACNKSHLPRELPQFPGLRRGEDIEHTFQGKIEILKNHFFPQPPEADLSDIPNTIYPEEIRIDDEITVEEIKRVIRSAKANKAPGPDGITNWVLQQLQDELMDHILDIFRACKKLHYHPRAFKVEDIVVLKKPSKSDYTVAKAYRPIALLNTLGKILESVMTRRLSTLAEQHSLLPAEQMGARKNRSTETALELLTEQIHTIWGSKGENVASLLCLDVSGAFDKVSHTRLLHNLKKKAVPEYIIRWVRSFLEERRTTLSINRKKSAVFDVACDIPQDSPISPILFLFFNAKLIEMCNHQNLDASLIGFVDDVNVLTYSKSTAMNCETLQRVHDTCLLWASKHGATFEPNKYELIHLARRPKKFDMKAIFTAGNCRIIPKENVRVLGIQIDPKLNWGEHVKKVKDKMTKQSAALGRLTASTWGATLRRSRLIYNTVQRLKYRSLSPDARAHMAPENRKI